MFIKFEVFEVKKIVGFIRFFGVFYWVVGVLDIMNELNGWCELFDCILCKGVVWGVVIYFGFMLLYWMLNFLYLDVMLCVSIFNLFLVVV